jgi:gamma-glutamyltranspeptidase
VAPETDHARAIAVAVPHPSGLDAARDVVMAGGGAIDAALAAAAALTVAYPHQCSIGGDLVALVRSRRGDVRAVLSIGAAAAAIDVDLLRASSDRMPAGGPQTVTVPGVVAGWAEMAEMGARLDLARILAPAVELARRGVAISPGLARATRARLDVVRADPGLSAAMLDAQRAPMPVGTVLRQPELARTLEAVGQDWRTFYDGEVAGLLVAALRGLGSPLSAGDFSAHRPELADPLWRVAHGLTWSVAPPPSQGASLLAVLGTTNGGVLDAGALAAACQAERRRDALLGDPRTGPVNVESLLVSTDCLPAALPAGPKPAGDTVAVTVVAGDGSAVTLIQSVFQSFGAGLLDPATGVVLHNRGSAFSLDPSHPGRARPGARPPHTLCPALAVGHDAVVALGCQGGRAQPWILSQLAGEVADAVDLTALLARPRWVIGSRDLGRTGPTLMLEPGVAQASGLVASAHDLGLEVAEMAGLHDEAGHVQVARLGPAGLTAASDIRADGRAEVLR